MNTMRANTRSYTSRAIEGWKNKAIAQALRIHEEAVRQYFTDWSTDEKLKLENGGSYSKLDTYFSITTYT